PHTGVERVRDELVDEDIVAPARVNRPRGRPQGDGGWIVRDICIVDVPERRRRVQGRRDCRRAGPGCERVEGRDDLLAYPSMVVVDSKNPNELRGTPRALVFGCTYPDPLTHDARAGIRTQV